MLNKTVEMLEQELREYALCLVSKYNQIQDKDKEAAKKALLGAFQYIEEATGQQIKSN